MQTRPFKIHFPYWWAIGVEEGTRFNLIKNTYWGEETSYVWEECDPNGITVECEIKMFEVIEIKKAYGDNGTNFFIEGIALEIDLQD